VVVKGKGRDESAERKYSLIYKFVLISSKIEKLAEALSLRQYIL